jgi:alanine dehydrogenase
VELALAEDSGLAQGVNVAGGKLVHPAVREAFADLA